MTYDEIIAGAMHHHDENTEFLLTEKVHLADEWLYDLVMAALEKGWWEFYQGVNILGVTEPKPSIDDEGYFGADFSLEFVHTNTQGSQVRYQLPMKLYIYGQGLTMFFKQP